MKRLLFVFFFVFSAFYLRAQWVDVGGGVNDAVVGLYAYNSNLYAGGVFTQAGGINAVYIASWNGSKWDSLRNGFKERSGYGIESFVGHDSILYACGEFDSINNLQYRSILQWNGSTYDSLDGGLTAVYGSLLSSVAMYNNELYACGNFVSFKKKIPTIAKWNGVSWDSVGKGVNGMPWTMITFNGKLIVGGEFDTAGRVAANDVASWDGIKWDSLGDGLQSGTVYSLAVCNGKLYAAGNFMFTGSLMRIYNIAVWDGVKWDSVGGGSNNTIYCMTVYNNKLYVGGTFDTIGHQAISQVAEWDGSQWLPMGNGLSGGSYGVFALAIYDSALYAGGGFANSGSTPLSNIAKWTGPLGVDEVKGESEKVKVWPNPSNGVFTIESSNIGQKSSVEIYNVLGDIVYKSEIGNPRSEINLSTQPQGIYLYKVTTLQGNLIGYGKLLIQ